jgi:Zn-dependent protease with chaperone function
MIKPTVIMLILTFFSAGIIGLVTSPFILLSKYSRKSFRINGNYVTNFIDRYSRKLNIKSPELYIIDIAKPIAFSFSFIKKRIFISIGMFDILSKKEVNAVLLHELAHIKNKSSLLKFSMFFIKLSPLAMFSSFNKELNDEEAKADSIILNFQRTNKYLVSAKKKILLSERV